MKFQTFKIFRTVFIKYYLMHIKMDGRTNNQLDDEDSGSPPQKKCRMGLASPEADEMTVDRISNNFDRTTDEIMVIILSFFAFYCEN